MINKKADYKKATNAASEIYTNFKSITFPINMFEIINFYPNIRLKKYSDMAKTANIDFYTYVKNNLPSEFGFTLKKGHRSIICYNDKKSDTTNAFTFAHELGHYVLKHIYDNNLTEKEANCFARNLLCPITFAKELNLKSVKDYMLVFGVSEPMAIACIGNSSADYYYIDNKLYHYINELVYSYMLGCSL